MDQENNQNDNKKTVKKNKKKRCFNCNKKIGLIEYTCRCSDNDKNKIFCSNCRHPKINENDDKGHLCTFDFKSYGRELLEKNNPQIIADKMTAL